jgi:hypothetical protein
MDQFTKAYSLDTGDYQKFGGNRPLNFKESDPVTSVLEGPDGVNQMFEGAGNPRRRQIGLARAFMSQRCAEKWDGYCDLFLKQENNADYTGKHVHAFIKDTLSRQFCQNDTSIPGSQCFQRCEQFNPTSSSSVSVCMDQGDLVYRQSEKVQAVDTLFPQTGKLSTTEPLRITKCPKVCNLFNEKSLSNDNVALNIALDKGIAMDLIENLVDNLVAANQQSLVTNDRLKDFMSKYLMNGSVKPGYANLGASPYRTTRPIAVPAVNPSLVSGDVYVVNPSGMNELVKTGKGTWNPYPPTNFTENFELEQKKDNKILYAILIISVIAICCFCMAKKSNK